MKHVIAATLAFSAITACTSTGPNDLPPAQVPLPPDVKPDQPEILAPDMTDPRNDSAALTANGWRVVTLLGQPAPQTPAATLTFDGDSKVYGSTGCNRYSASYRLTDTTLRLSQALSTKKACPGPQMTLEISFNTALTEIRQFTIGEDGTLTLSSDAETLMVAVPLPEDKQ